MNLPYQLFIGLRYLRTKKRQRGISVNTAISIAGVMLGVMALIIVLSVMSGFQEELQKKLLGVNAHLIILSYDGMVKEQELLREKIATVKGIKVSSPFIYGQAMLGFGGRAHGVVVRGIEPELEKKTTDILKNLKGGSISALQKNIEPPGIIVGIELSRNLGLFIGDKVNMISPAPTIGPLGMLPRIKKFKVVGVFDAGFYEYDSSLAYINLRDAQEFFKYQDAVTGIEIRLEDINKVEGIAKKIEDMLGPPYYTKDWMQMNRSLFAALKLEKIVMFIILTLIVLVASFNIVSNLVMIVIEKSKEIAILKAMGATNKGVMSIFMVYGLVIGLVGTCLGLLGGFVACYLLKTYKFINLPPDIYHLSYLPVKMDLTDFIIVPSAAIFISFLATIYPSWQAARLNPVEPLRYE